jgi:hypothetical protein
MTQHLKKNAMYFSNEVVTNEDLIKDYQQTIETYKRSIQRMINNPDENSDRRIKMAEASIKKYQEYIKQNKIK